MRGAVRKIAIIVGDTEYLPARAAQRAQLQRQRLHSAPAPAAATGGISCAVGCACFSACRQIFAV